MEFLRKYWWLFLLLPVVLIFLYYYAKRRQEIERNAAKAREAKALKNIADDSSDKTVG